MEAASNATAALQRAMPIVSLFCNAEAVHYMGPPGSGQAVKAVNNMLLAANIATATEALTLLRKAGVPAEVQSVIEDKQRGLVAQVAGPAEDEAVSQVLGGFVWSWERAP